MSSEREMRLASELVEKIAKKEVPEAFKKEWKNKDKDDDGKKNEPKPDFLKKKEKSAAKQEVIKVPRGGWTKILKDPNIKTISMVGGRDGADYEVIYKDRTSKLFKFASNKIERSAKAPQMRDDNMSAADWKRVRTGGTFKLKGKNQRKLSKDTYVAVSAIKTFNPDFF